MWKPNKRKVTSIDLQSIRDNTPLKMSMWWHFFTCSIKTTSSRPVEVGQTNDPNYCLFHRMVHHPTCRCNVLKDKIQALIEVGVFTLKSEYKRPLPHSYPEREYGGSQLYFQKPWVLFHQRLKQRDSSQFKAKASLAISLAADDTCWLKFPAHKM